MTTQQFSGQGQVGYSPPRLAIIFDYWFTVAGGFGQTYISWNNGTINSVPEIIKELSIDLRGEFVPRVIHGAENTLNLEGWIDPPCSNYVVCEGFSASKKWNCHAWLRRGSVCPAEGSTGYVPGLECTSLFVIG
jgi:hypothetical protein